MRQSRLKPLAERIKRNPRAYIRKTARRLENLQRRAKTGKPAPIASIKELMDFIGGVPQHTDDVMRGALAKGLPKNNPPGIYTRHLCGGMYQEARLAAKGMLL